MKRSIFFAVLGMAATVALSYGQGFVRFSSYTANDGVGATTSFALGFTGLVGTGYTAYLYYAFGTVSDSVDESSLESILSPVSPAFTLLSGVSAAYADSGGSIGVPGYFDGPVVTIPGYSGGPITFEIFASDASGIFYGRSGSFTMDSIANSTSVQATFFGDNGEPMSNFYVTTLPEPSSLMLVGLGGLVSLMIFRRKP